MKSFFSLLLGVFVLSLLTSCEKNNLDDQNHVLTPREELLIAQTWVYNEYFTDYRHSSAKVAYKLGKPNNAVNLSLNKVSFKKDRTYLEVTSTGDTLAGTWQFLNGETQLEVKNSMGVFVSNIIVLNDNNFTWLDTHRNIFSRMLPANTHPLVTIANSKLVGKKWMYSEYFVDFSSNSTGLAYKRDKENNLLDLSKNRVVFNYDGSVTEIDENGTSIPGAWKFINMGADVGTEVNNYAGKFKSIFIYLNDSNYVWYDPINGTYGKMVVAEDDVVPVVSARAKLLCSKTWLYSEYFSNYSDDFPVAELSYSRYKQTNNPLNLSLNKDTFRLDGTYTEINENGTAINGTWQFLDNETKMKITNHLGTYEASILLLNDTSFIWHDISRKTFAKMAPSGYKPSKHINLNLLTGKKWVYTEYFSDFATQHATLVFKRERASNFLTLKQNYVQFNSDGTFDELNESGQQIRGNWDIISSKQLRTISSFGTFIADLIHLDDNNLVWHNPSLDTYGRMTIKSN